MRENRALQLLALRKAQVDRLQRQVEGLERDNDRLKGDCLKLWLAIQRIGGLNDSPSHYNPDIDLVIAGLSRETDLEQ